MSSLPKWFCFFILLLLLVGISSCQTADLITINGTVSGTEGSNPESAYIIILSTDDYSMVNAPVTIDPAGKYTINEVPAGKNYILLTVPLSSQQEGEYHLHGFTPKIIRVDTADGDLSRNIVVSPGHDFIFEVYQPDGSLLHNDNWIGTRFAEDMAGSATRETFIGIEKGDKSLTVPNICVPLGEKRRFFFQRLIPGFGRVVLAADNQGAGYSADAPGGTILNTGFEIARTQLHRLRTNLKKYRTAGYTIPASIGKDLNSAELQLFKAANLQGADQAAAADKATGTALWALEYLELARAEQDILRFRMGSSKITVVDENGIPLPGLIVTYSQKSQDFLFGIFDSVENAGIEGYALMEGAGVNYLTNGFYWNETEPKQNKIKWERIDHRIGVLDLYEMGFTLKSHALLALWDFATPEYLMKMTFDDFNREVEEHISALVSRYKDPIEIWNVINEAHGRGAALDFSREQVDILTRTGIRAIRDNDPEARIIINNSFDWYGESRAGELLTRDEHDNFTISVPVYLDQLAEKGMDFDIIGQQLYNGGLVTIFADLGLGNAPFGVPTWDLAHHSAVLDLLGTYGKPVHITEQSVPSAWGPAAERAGAGWWHHPWDEQTQAEFVRNFYTIAFSKKQMEAVTWWNINDSYSFIANGGLLDKNNNPKPAYYTLRDLIAGWRSSGQVTTDSSGQALIRGYGGKYILMITQGSQTREEAVHIHEQQQGEITIRLSDNS